MSEYICFNHQEKRFNVLMDEGPYTKEELLEIVKQLEEREQTADKGGMIIEGQTTKQYTHQIYETAYVELPAGKYSRSDLAALLTHFEELDKANAAAIKQTGGELIKEIPKPAGFDLRNRRSDKTHKAADWLPADALFDANEAIKKHECKELLIIWWEEKPNQKRSLHWRNATSSAAEASHLLVNMFFDKDHF